MLVVTEPCVLCLTDLQAGTSLSPPFRGGEHQGAAVFSCFVRAHPRALALPSSDGPRG